MPITILNSDADELMPVMAPDGQKLFFVRSNHPGNTGGKTAGQDIWFSTWNKSDNTWQKPQNIGAPLNNIYNNAISSFSPNGDRVWLSNVYLSRNRMAPGLSFAAPTETGWSKPEAVTIENFTPETGFLNFYQATDSILLLSMQTDTAQLEDIYVSRRLGPKLWSEPVSLGTPINTRGFEIAPFLAPDKRTLYFASNGHGGLGDADIFMSKRLDNTWLHWSEPVNLGHEVNSAGFEAYFMLDATGEKAYFTSENGEKEDTDIYTIRVEDIFLPENTPATSKTPELPQTKEGVPGPAGDKTVLPTLVYFEVNSAVLNPVGQASLRLFFNQVQANKNRALSIMGHADETGTEKTNKDLSWRRARAVADFLVAQGWPPKLMHVQAFGSTQPVASNQSVQDRAKNRRVEIQVADG